MPDREAAAVTRRAARTGEAKRRPKRGGARRRLNLPAFMSPARTIPQVPGGLENLFAAAAAPDFPLRYVPPPWRLSDQGPSLWCWAAMGESIARYYDPNSRWTQCRLANRLRRPGEEGSDCCTGGGHQCNWMRTMDEVFREIGHLREPRRDGPISFEEIGREIDQGRPICVRVTPQNQGHFVAIAGVERVGGVDKILVNDPARRDSKVPYTEFLTYYEGLSSWTHTYLTRREGGRPWA